MKILVICSFFPPDTEIGAVKPYMISKYLSQFGHEVTVLRMGYIKEMADNSYGDYKKGLEIVNAQGPNSDVDRLERGELVIGHKDKTHIHLPKWIDLSARFFLQPIITYRRIRRKDKLFKLQKGKIDLLKERGKKYDIVYSTFFELENIFAGEYAAKTFDAKWILEFRDPVKDTKVINYPGFEIVWNTYANIIVKHALAICDICTCVSEDLAKEFKAISPSSDIKIMYNGYDTNNSDINIKEDLIINQEILSICYTGTLWEESIFGLESLILCINRLIEEGVIDEQKIRIHYAGKSSNAIKELFSRYGRSGILDDHGYVSRDQAELIQKRSDIFLVLSWNTKQSKGILTGKFYEGIKAEKPILSIVHGNEPNSELLEINNKYHYGFCYETAQESKMANPLSNFIVNMYNQKITKGYIDYEPEKELKEAFHYKNITKQFEMWCEELMREK